MQRIELGAVWFAIAVLFILQVGFFWDAYRVPKDGPSRAEVVRSNSAIEARLIELEIQQSKGAQ